jgi:hypothetical protein
MRIWGVRLGHAVSMVFSIFLTGPLIPVTFFKVKILLNKTGSHLEGIWNPARGNSMYLTN